MQLAANMAQELFQGGLGRSLQASWRPLGGPLEASWAHLGGPRGSQEVPKWMLGGCLLEVGTKLV